MASDLQFWYEFGSTYSYLSIMRIESLALDNKINISWKPFLLGPVFKEQGWEDSPFNIYPMKGKYMWRDMEREAKKLAIPFKRPSMFPRNGLLAARIAIFNSNKQWCSKFSKAVYRANFYEDLDIGNPDIIIKILESLDLDPENIIQQAQSLENKNKLKEQTKEAMTLGIFGAPSFIVQNELFWGNDRLEDAIRLLQ